MQQNKTVLSDELVILLNRLALNGDIRMAGHVLYAYFIRFWKIDDTARFYVSKYFEKHYPKQLHPQISKQVK
ncbi:hypothetical protein [Brevibacillus migulae]|uniref:hypothetical protein n=1 Tax=Brevibacillus migulae TaxID=1644114 RepID=UPI00106F0A2A|nr:hypothetical protein [Brevibacillus migulae]